MFLLSIKNAFIKDCCEWKMSSFFPENITLPPSLPDPGPNSIKYEQKDKAKGSCSEKTIVLPFSINV